MTNNFNITSIPNQPREIIDIEKTKNEIITSQQINGFITINILLKKEKIKNGIFSYYTENEEDNLTFNVNIIGNETTPFSQIKDLFVIYLNKEILEDNKKPNR